jgi:predicted DsbA family dithiol-disulfide isomerase
MNRRMKALMEAEALPYGERRATYNSRLAQELAKWAQGQPDGDRIHQALFRAYFVDGKNIAKPKILLEVVKQVALSATEAFQVLESHVFKDAVDADWRRSWDLGVTGVPTYMIGGFKLIGAQPYEELEKFVITAREALDSENRLK